MKKIIALVVIAIIFAIYATLLFSAEKQQSLRAQDAKANWVLTEANIKNFRKAEHFIRTEPLFSDLYGLRISQCYNGGTYLFETQYAFNAKEYSETKYVCYGSQKRYKNKTIEKIYINPENPSDTCILRGGHLGQKFIDDQALSCLNFRKIKTPTQ